MLRPRIYQAFQADPVRSKASYEIYFDHAAATGPGGDAHAALALRELAELGLRTMMLGLRTCCAAARRRMRGRASAVTAAIRLTSKVMRTWP